MNLGQVRRGFHSETSEQTSGLPKRVSDELSIG